ncbi:hypothetical protein D3C71_1213650 [compost metagenome]
MDVQRQRTRQRVAVGDRLAQRRCIEAVMEVRRGGIGGVARPRPVMPAQQIGIEGPGQATGSGRERVHGASIAPDHAQRLDPDQSLAGTPSTGSMTCGQRSIW